MHIARNHHVKRQSSDDPLSVASAAGIGSATTAAATPVIATGSLLLASQSVEAVSASFNLIATASGAITVSSTPSAAISPSPSSSAVAAGAASSGSSSISMGTVIGICVGAFAGLAVLVLFVVWILKRTAPTSSRRAQGGPSASSPHNARGEDDRRRSRLEPWSKLGDDDDRWDGMHHAAEKAGDHSVESDKFSMFHKTPSMRSASDEKGHNDFDMSTMPNFATYHPDLAEEFAKAPERPFMGRIDGAPVISWDGETVGDDSFLSMRSVRMSDTAVVATSPTTVMARQTPQATSSALHRWESAEVLTMDITDTPAPQDDESKNPFADEVEHRKSAANPFFNAQPGVTHNPFSDTYTVKGRNRRSSVKSRSISTTSDGHEQAMQSLIAALDIPETLSPTPERDMASRVSMQPSINSELLTADNETMSAFPMPPSPKAV